MWVAERGEFLDVWIVSPAAPPRALEGTQLATYENIDGRWWSEALRIPAPEVVDIDELIVPPVEPEIDLGLDRGEDAAENAG